MFRVISLSISEVIEDVEAIVLKRENNVIIRVRSSGGKIGIGHADSCSLVKDLVEKYVKRILIGENPLNINKLWFKMYRDESLWYGYRGMWIHAIAGVDMALWDLAGKILDRPVWSLLGGRFRDKVIPYASISFPETEEKTREVASLYAEQGFKAVKFGWGLFGRVSVNKNVELVKAAREGLGWNVELMVDAGRPWSATLKHMIKTVRRIERYEPFFLEEPFAPDNFEDYRTLRRVTEIPIAGGEIFSTVTEFRRFIEDGCVDIVQPDPSRVGLTQFKEIASIAASRGIMCIPHDWSTALNVLAQIHLVASIPNGLYVEYHRPQGPPERANIEKDLMDNLIIPPLELKKGFFKVPDRPGLGAELNSEVLKRLTRHI